MLKRFLLGNANQAQRNSYIWNMIASVVNALEAIIILMVATRTIGVEESGVLSIAFSIANLMLTIGMFGVRNYQVTDFEDRYSFRDYLHSRNITVVLMAIATFGYVAVMLCMSKYSLQKAIIICLVTGLYMVEAYENVYVAYFQRNKRLDIGMKIFTVRWAVALIIWGISLVLIKNSLISVLIAFAVSIIVLAVLIMSVRSEIEFGEAKAYKDTLNLAREILANCLPLCLAGFFSYYISNASKYAIDMYLSDEIQACYGFVAMPIFVISLLNTIVYQPILVDMAEKWNNGETRRFVYMILRQTVIVIIISSVCLLGAWLIGIPVLSAMYATDLTNYKMILMLLLVAGLGLAMTGFFNTVITIMRKQMLNMYIYCVFAVMAFVISPVLVKNLGVNGASYVNLILNNMEAFVMAVVIFVLIKRRNAK